MITKQDILKMAKTVFKRSRGKYQHQLMHPTREWLIGLFCSAIFLVVGSVWVWGEFAYYQNLRPEGGQLTQPDVQYREVAVRAAIDRFSEKAVRYNTILNAEPLVDPIVPEVKIEEESASSTASSTAVIMIDGASAESEDPATIEESPATTTATSSETDSN